MEQATIDALRRRLDDERTHLLTQLADMGVDPTTGAPDGDQFEQGFADSGQSTAEKARMLSMTEGVFESLREVDDALVRMTKGTYGVCESCHKPIGDERLDARPVASLCLDCKRRAG